jgi:hypothetical protein
MPQRRIRAIRYIRRILINAWLLCEPSWLRSSQTSFFKAWSVERKSRPMCSTAVPNLFTLENCFWLNHILARQGSS